MGATPCELCGAPAALRCEPDAAFLCWTCDARVHGANFLVARHARRPICTHCGGAAEAAAVSGPKLSPARFVCAPCSGAAAAASDSESSTRRGSNTGSSGCESSGGPARKAALEACRGRLGMRRASRRRAVAAAAAVWLAAGGEAAPAPLLRRLEAWSGVRARVILAAAARLARAASRRQRWAECA
ncbi:uncharacterized protein LOC144708949 [Wolffia australiana]